MTSQCSPSWAADAGSSGRTPALLYANSGSTSMTSSTAAVRSAASGASPVSLFMCKPRSGRARTRAARDVAGAGGVPRSSGTQW